MTVLFVATVLLVTLLGFLAGCVWGLSQLHESQ